MPRKHRKARRPPLEAFRLGLRRTPSALVRGPRALLHGPVTLARRSPLALALNLLAAAIVLGAIAYATTRLT